MRFLYSGDWILTLPNDIRTFPLEHSAVYLILVKFSNELT